MGDVFLSRQEQDAIQKIYSTFLTDVRPVKIIPYLYSHHVFNMPDKQMIETERTDWGKNDRLYEFVLARATYREVSIMRDALIHSEDPRHIHIAGMLPRRETYANPDTVAIRNRDPPSYDTLQPRGNQMDHFFDITNQGPRSGASMAHPAGGNRDTYWEAPSYEESRGDYALSTPYQESFDDRFSSMSLHHQSHSYSGSRDSRPSAMDHSSTTYYELPMQHQHLNSANRRSVLPQSCNSRSLDETRRKSRMPEPTRQNSMPVNSSQNNQASIERSPSLGFYPTRSKPDGVGTGLCVIIANFTHDLPGYIHDRREITRFFQDVLKYRVLGGFGSEKVKDFENLNRGAFMTKLNSVQNHLKDEYSDYDRFVLFVMSHGNQNGIKMCANKEGLLEEKTQAGKSVTVRPEEIVHMFTHDQVSKLRDMPKCFFLQHCRGGSSVKAAANSFSCEKDENTNNPPLAAVGSDTAIFYSTCPNNKSFVNDSKGSWFIQNTIKFMREYHETEHVEDIMSAVNQELSVTHNTEEDGKDAHQISQKASSLRKKFYLKIPQHRMQGQRNN